MDDVAINLKQAVWIWARLTISRVKVYGAKWHKWYVGQRLWQQSKSKIITEEYRKYTRNIRLSSSDLKGTITSRRNYGNCSRKPEMPNQRHPGHTADDIPLEFRLNRQTEVGGPLGKVWRVDAGERPRLTHYPTRYSDYPLAVGCRETALNPIFYIEATSRLSIEAALDDRGIVHRRSRVEAGPARLSHRTHFRHVPSRTCKLRANMNNVQPELSFVALRTPISLR